MTGSRPVIVGYDGSAASDYAVREAAAVVAPRSLLVVAVWEPGLAFEMLEPTIPLAPIDIRVAFEIDKEMYERAQRMAERGAALARKAGAHAEALAVADDITVAATLLRLAEERDAAAIAVGAHGHGAFREVLFGSTSHEVLKESRRPVIVVNSPQPIKD